jgi:hypothetical protein
VSENQKRTREETGRAQTGDGSANDQGYRVLGNAAYQAADLEDEDSG